MTIMLLLTCFAWNNTDGYTAANFDDAIKQSAVESKPILLDFYTTWCPGCVKFDREIESDKQLQALLETVVFVRVNCESEKGTSLAREYQVAGYPTFVLLNPNDAETHSMWLGYGDFGTFSKRVKAGFVDKTEEELIAAYKANPTPEEAHRLATKALTKGELDVALQYLKIAASANLDMGYGEDSPESIVFFRAIGETRQNPDRIPFDQLEDLLNTLISQVDTDMDRVYFTVLFLDSVYLSKRPVNTHLQRLTQWLKTPYDVDFKRSEKSAEHFNSRRRYSRGRAAINLLAYSGLPEKALDHYPLTMSRDDYVTRSSYWNNRAWMAFEYNVRLEEAEVWATKGVELATNNSSKLAVLDTLAQIQMRLGKSEEAMKNIDAAIELDPGMSYLVRQKRKFLDILDFQGNDPVKTALNDE